MPIRNARSRIRWGHRRWLEIVGICAVLTAGCSETTTNLVSDDDAGVDFSDADPRAADAARHPGCTPGSFACNNCIDDDGDGLIDGFDPECTGATDDREDSFATGLPGDNKDEKIQDCFFDGNSGSGDDKCRLHTCCLLDGPCPENLQPPAFNPNDCKVSSQCIANCAPLAPPGCDCFGCCTICNSGLCRDILINPAVAPDCTHEVLANEQMCPACRKIEDCGGGNCGDVDCILCPGETLDQLPSQCEDQACPGGRTPCRGDTDCLSNQYCSAGCCIAVID
jgi:hypothetical protein